MTPEQARADFERIHRAIDDNDFKLATKLQYGLFTAAAAAIESVSVLYSNSTAYCSVFVADIERTKAIAKLALDAQQIAFERDWT